MKNLKLCALVALMTGSLAMGMHFPQVVSSQPLTQQQLDALRAKLQAESDAFRANNPQQSNVLPGMPAAAK